MEGAGLLPLERAVLGRGAFLLPCRVFLLLGAEQQLLGPSAITPRLPGCRWGGGVCLRVGLLRRWGPLGTGQLCPSP